MSVRGVVVLTVLLAARGAGLPALAQEARPGASDPDSALAEALASIGGTTLTLTEALAQAEKNATMLRVAEAGLEAARGSVQRERGAFDPELFATVNRASDDSPTTSPFAGADVLQTDNTEVQGGARVTLPFGTEVEAVLATNRQETNSTFATLNPQFRTSGEISLRHPLLSGFGPASRQDLTSAERALDAEEAHVRDIRLALEARVSGLYWDLYAAGRDLAVFNLLQERARAILTETEVRGRAGLTGPGQVANARVFLSERELAALDAEERLDSVSDALASLMGTRPAAGVPRFRPTSEPALDVRMPDVETLVAQAVAENSELKAERARLEQVRGLAQAARWNALPSLDLVGALGGNGLSGTGRDVVFGADTLFTDVNGGFGDTWSQVVSRDFPTWRVGVELTLPLGLREGRGEHRRLLAETSRVEQQLLDRERRLGDRVRAAHRELLHGERRLSAARGAVAATREQVRIGLVEYLNGRTTAVDLVRLGGDLASAQQSYSRALVSTAKAAAELRYLTAGAVTLTTP